MPPYTLPGSDVGPRKARVLGACALAVAIAVTVAWRLVPESAPADEIGVALIVKSVGEGIGPGTEIRLDGVRVGTVDTIDFAGDGRRKIDLRLIGSQLFGLTTGMTVDYVPGNLFGVSALELHAASTGTLLRNGSIVDLTGPDSGRIRDATLAALLNSTGELTTDVLTPQLARLLRTFARDLDAFTPLLQAIGTTARSYAETRQLPPSLLFEEFGSALAGLPPMLTGGLTLLDASYNNGYLREEEHIEKFAQMWPNIQNQLLPVVTQLFGTAQPYFAGLLPIATLVLDRITGSVSDPALATRQLRELLDRLGGTFHDTPDGPVVDVRIDLDLVPGVTGPLTEALGHVPAPGGER
ncbi:MlaD family protein [Nocardia jejuensis]|uniref:MlaD family protein n=1 Tax=Nocardia jejuensis TaxID=328049 RepID=UPI000836606E|nr:MlaD family protein [Nocardia jejuensis]